MGPAERRRGIGSSVNCLVSTDPERRGFGERTWLFVGDWRRNEEPQSAGDVEWEIVSDGERLQSPGVFRLACPFFTIGADSDDRDAAVLEPREEARERQQMAMAPRSM